MTIDIDEVFEERGGGAPRVALAAHHGDAIHRIARVCDSLLGSFHARQGMIGRKKLGRDAGRDAPAFVSPR